MHGTDTHCDSERIAVCEPQLTVFRALVYHIYGARLFTAQRPPRISEYAVEKRVYL